MSLLDNMPHEVTITRPVHSRQSGKMASKRTFKTVSTKVMAWVQNATMSEINEWGKRGMKVTHKILFNQDLEATIGLRESDVFTVTAGPSFVGKVINNRAFTERTAGKGWMWKAMGEEDR